MRTERLHAVELADAGTHGRVLPEHLDGVRGAGGRAATVELGEVALSVTPCALLSHSTSWQAQAWRLPIGHSSAARPEMADSPPTPWSRTA
jgi:hypothetical protein